MNKRSWLFPCFLIAFIFLGPIFISSTFAKDKAPPPKGVVYIAKYLAQPFPQSGSDNPSIWKETPSYSLERPKNTTENIPASLKATLGDRIKESGSVKFLWNEKGLYVRGEFQDSDIVAEGTKDQEHHYTLGDLMEVFLKPAAQTWYWELYATPQKLKTAFFFPGGGRLFLPSCAENPSDLSVDAFLQGTLNQWKDRDQGWIATMFVPIQTLTSQGDSFGGGSHWKVLLGRYNYSRYLRQVEHSSAPQLSALSFHLQEEYATLKLEK